MFPLKVVEFCEDILLNSFFNDKSYTCNNFSSISQKEFLHRKQSALDAVLKFTFPPDKCPR